MRRVACVLLLACGQPVTPAAVSVTAPNTCAASDLDVARAGVLRDQSSLRAAADTLDRVDEACVTPNVLRSIIELDVFLGRVDALGVLRTRRPLDHEAIDQAIARASSKVETIVELEAVLAQTGSRSAIERALDLLERRYGLKAERATFGDASTARFEAKGRWIILTFDGGDVMFDTQTWRAFAPPIPVGLVDASGRWMASVQNPTNDLTLLNLEERQVAIRDRELTSEPMLARPNESLFYWVERDQTIHFFDGKARTERSFPVGGELSDAVPIQFSGSATFVAWLSTTGSVDSLHAVAIANGEPRVLPWVGSRGKAIPKRQTATSVSIDDAGLVGVAWAGGPVMVHRVADESIVTRVEQETISLALDDKGTEVAWLDSGSDSIGGVDLSKNKPWRVPYGNKRGLGLDVCGGGMPVAIESIDGHDVNVDCASGDVGSMLHYDTRGGPFHVVSSWSPGDEFRALQDDTALCARARVDCGCTSTACENLHDTAVGPLVLSPEGAVTIDPKTSAVAQHLDLPRNEKVFTSPDSTWVVSMGSSVRIRSVKDARYGTRSLGVWCRIGNDLFAGEICR